MELSNIQINHLRMPMGFDLFCPFSVSYTLEHTRGKIQTSVHFMLTRACDGVTIYDSGKLTQVLPAYPLTAALSPRTRYRLTIHAETDANERAEAESWFETGKMDESWHAQWIGAADDCTSFCAETQILVSDLKRARLYVGCAGLYTLHINGRRVGKEYLTPYCNAYDAWMQVITHDVTEYLREGQNTLRFTLGSGWYKGRFSLMNRENIYGDRLAVIAELVLTHSDGSEERRCTDESWRVFSSEYTQNGIYDGVHIDAGLPPQQKALRIFSIPKGLLRDRLSPPVTVQQEIKPVRAFHTPAGAFCLDFGQNLAGLIRVDTAQFPAADFRLRFFETLDPDGNVYTKNLRTAKQELVYRSNGEARTIVPEFTYYGFRYVWLDADTELPPDAFTALVLHSEMPEAGALRTSNPDLNRLIENIAWSQRGNFVDLPTDCPQRDERLGWTGDAQIFSGASLFSRNCAAFWEKFLYDLRREQEKNADGHVPVTVPTFVGKGDHATMNAGLAGWGDAAAIIPWNLYLHTGDLAQLRRQYPAMLDWCRYIRSCDTGNHLWDNGFQLGDWLALDTPQAVKFGQTPEALVASSYYLYSVTLTAKAANALGDTETQAELESLADKIRDAIRKEFVTAGGRIAGGTQTADVLALYLDFAANREKTAADLRDKIMRKANGHLNTGFIGTAYLCHALSESGCSDLAYSLLLSREYPGWLYEVEHGATTIWERWNGIHPDGALADPEMNSFNHYANGAILEWMYRHMAGLQPIAAAPGFQQIRYAPQPDGRLQFCKSQLLTPFGLYMSEWEITADALCFSLRIPCSCTAELVLPDAPPVIHINGAAHPYTPGMTLPSGTYRIIYAPTRCYYVRYDLETPAQVVFSNEKLLALLLQIVPQTASVPPVLSATAHESIRALLDASGISLNDAQRKELESAWAAIHQWDL